MFNSADESLKDKTRLPLLWYDSPLTHIVFIHWHTTHIIFIHITSVMKPVHIFMARNIVSKSCLMTELCFHRLVHFGFLSIYIFGFHYKQWASNENDFIFVNFILQMFSSVDESLKDEMPQLLFWNGSLVTLHTFYSSI